MNSANGIGSQSVMRLIYEACGLSWDGFQENSQGNFQENSQEIAPLFQKNSKRGSSPKGRSGRPAHEGH